MQPGTRVEIVRRLRALIPRGAEIPPRKTRLSIARYLDADEFAAERRALFRRTPTVAAHASELSEIGACVARRVAEIPVVLVNDAGRVRAFLNACRHRGAELLRPGEACTRKALVCPYHAWSYRLDGSLLHVPDEPSFDGIEREGMGLVELACERRHGLIWICPEGPLDLTRFLGPAIDADLSGFALAEHGLEGEPRLERVLAPKSEPKSEPKVESEGGTPRPLDKWLPERTAENPVLKRAYEGRVWIDPRGGGGLFVTTLGQSLVLVGLDAELAAAHGRRVRLDGTVWTCGGVWRGSANKLTPLDDSPPAQSPGDTRPPPIPIVRTREDLERVFAPWVLVTGTIAGHWERDGSDDGDGSDGATLRLDDGFEFEVVDLPNKVLRRVVQGDRVSASVRLADLEQRARGRSTALFEGTYSVELVALCVGDRERCAAADVGYYKPTLWQLKCRLASQRRASAPPYQPPPAPRSRPLPSVACQQYARDPPPGCEG